MRCSWPLTTHPARPSTLHVPVAAARLVTAAQIADTTWDRGLQLLVNKAGKTNKRVFTATVNVAHERTAAFMRDLAQRTGGGWHSFSGDLSDVLEESGAVSQCDGDDIALTRAEV